MLIGGDNSIDNFVRNICSHISSTLNNSIDAIKRTAKTSGDGNLDHFDFDSKNSDIGSKILELLCSNSIVIDSRLSNFQNAGHGEIL